MNIFFAMDCGGALIGTGFHYAKLIIDCKKKGHNKIVIHHHSGSSLVFEEIDINARLGLQDHHRFHRFGCLVSGHLVRSTRNFEKNKWLDYCKCCGKELTVAEVRKVFKKIDDQETKKRLVKWLIIIGGILWIIFSCYMTYRSGPDEESEFNCTKVDPANSHRRDENLNPSSSAGGVKPNF